MSKAAAWLTAVLFAVLTLMVSAESGSDVDDPADWLQRMDQAFATQNYDGSFSFFSGEDLSSLRVVHMVVDGVQRERLVHLNGAPREIVREGEDVSCIVLPGDDLLSMESSMPAGPFARAFVRQFDNISDYYTLEFLGEDRVAWRAARRLVITPKDAHRFGFRLWLDEKTALLLRSELIDGDGKRLEIFQFTNITIGDAVEVAALEPQNGTSGMVSHLSLAGHKAVTTEDVPVSWFAKWMPPGFSMAAAEERRKNSNLTAVSTLVYTDGVSAFSIFVEDMPDTGASAMVSRNGATVAVTKARKIKNREHLVTVVGELPTATADRIAAEVSPGPGYKPSAAGN